MVGEKNAVTDPGMRRCLSPQLTVFLSSSTLQGSRMLSEDGYKVSNGIRDKIERKGRELTDALLLQQVDELVLADKGSAWAPQPQPLHVP